MASSSVTRTSSPNNHDHNEGSIEVMELEVPSLPLTDHGKDAILVLAGCTLIQAPVWGKHGLTFRHTLIS
jgi:hypothetical protein